MDFSKTYFAIEYGINKKLYIKPIIKRIHTQDFWEYLQEAIDTNKDIAIFESTCVLDRS